MGRVIGEKTIEKEIIDNTLETKEDKQPEKKPVKSKKKS